MSDSVWPHWRQPSRLLQPWDSPGKNTGVGCHFLLQCMKGKRESDTTQRPHGLQPTRLLRPWDFPGKSTGVGCQCLLRWPGGLQPKGSQRVRDELLSMHQTLSTNTYIFPGTFQRISHLMEGYNSEDFRSYVKPEVQKFRGKWTCLSNHTI